MTVHFTREEMREIRARAWWAWAKDNPEAALDHFYGGKPPARLSTPAGGKQSADPATRPRRPKPKGWKRREAHTRKLRHER